MAGAVVKGVLGCGCATLLVAGVALAGLGWLGWQAAQEVREYAKNVGPEQLERLREEFKVPDVAREQVNKALERPFEQADADRFIALNDWYYANPANERASKLMDFDWSDPSRLVDALQDREAQQAVTELLKAFPAQVEQQGGWSKSVDSAVRTVTVAALAEGVALTTGKSASSPEVAAAMLQNADKLRDPAWLKSMDVGVLEDVLGRVPRASLQNWQAMPEAKRARVVEAWRRQGKAALQAQFNPILNTCRTLGVCG